MQRKQVLFIADSLDNAHKFQQILSAMDVDVSAGSSLQFKKLLSQKGDVDLVILEVRGDVSAELANAEQLLVEAGGVNLLAMVRLADFEIELIQPGDGTVVPTQDGVIPHFAIEVEDLPLVVNELRAMGLDTFRTEEPVVLPKLFGGLQNIFFKGPSGELIELIEHFEAGEHEPRL